MHVCFGSSSAQLSIRAHQKNAGCGCPSLSCLFIRLPHTEERTWGLVWSISTAESTKHSSKVNLKRTGEPTTKQYWPKKCKCGGEKIHIFPHSCVLTLQKQTSCWRSVCKRQDRQHDVFLTPHIGTFLKWQARWLTEWLCKLTQGNCQRWNTVMSLQANLHWTGER